MPQGVCHFRLKKVIMLTTCKRRRLIPSVASGGHWARADRENSRGVSDTGNKFILQSRFTIPLLLGGGKGKKEGARGEESQPIRVNPETVKYTYNGMACL